MHLKRDNSKGKSSNVMHCCSLLQAPNGLFSLNIGSRMNTSSSYLMLSTSSLPQFLVCPLTKIRDLCASCKFTYKATLSLKADDTLKGSFDVTDCAASHDADKESTVQQQHGPA